MAQVLISQLDYQVVERLRRQAAIAGADLDVVALIKEARAKR